MSECYINKKSQLNDTGKWEGDLDNPQDQDIQEAKEKNQRQLSTINMSEIMISK